MSRWKTPLLTIGLLVIPVIEIARWIRVAKEIPEGHEARVAAYLAPLPAFVQSATLITFILLGFSLAAVAVSFRGLDLEGAARTVSLSLLTIAALLSGWLLFTLM